MPIIDYKSYHLPGCREHASGTACASQLAKGCAVRFWRWTRWCLPWVTHTYTHQQMQGCSVN